MQTLESLAYTLNHIFLEDRKVKKYEMPESDNNLMAAEPEPLYGKEEKAKKQQRETSTETCSL